ncbi:carbohydrate kinase family protein [Bittarella massiliensis]|uniref:carbohydrate kinase family protein n=1 Tax=Bittarella massiliensis (ex Durand et al. 2017) TaxID=1720313 RepID=UPI00163C9997|nr:carbohydrate kinase family protein [Bittarella massiliensis (ex Durand et al. 2017)]MBC2872018.1 carbohydrate kinase family protein [Bittarella massiliensis (ex Durand et al. 2017)]
MNCELVVAGNLSLDDVSLPDGSRQKNVIGGDALYGALGARLWCPGVGMLSRRAGDFSPESLQRCREAGIDLAGVPLFPGASLHSLAVYRADGGRQFTELSPPGTREAMSPRAEDIPPAYRRCRATFLSALPIDNQRELAEAFHRAGALVLLDPYEGDASGRREAVKDALRWVDVFLPSEEEAVRLLGPLEGERDFEGAAQTFASWGPGAVVIKRGAEGCLLYERAEDRFVRLPCRPTRAVDTTGAGDTFGGGLAAGLLRTGKLVEAACCGTISASYAVESFGPQGLFEAERSGAEGRLEAYLKEKRSGEDSGNGN